MPKDAPHLQQRRRDELDARRQRGEPLWEPLDGEPPRTYQWFLRFLQTRDFDAVAGEFGVSLQAVYDASARWHWRERMLAFQQHLARALMEQTEYELAELLSISVAYLREALLDTEQPAPVRLRAAETVLRYTLGRRAEPARVQVEVQPAADPLEQTIREINALALERLRQRTPVDADDTLQSEPDDADPA